LTNVFSTGGADGDGVKDAARLFKLAASKCPDTIIIGGGYSQGAAIMHRAAKGLPKDVEDRIAGVALFGDTQNYQSKGHIVGFPPEKSKVFCQPGDGVCNGLLNVNLGHLAYSNRGNAKLIEGADWILERVNAAKAAKAAKASPKEEPEAAATPAPKAAATPAPKATAPKATAAPVAAAAAAPKAATTPAAAPKAAAKGTPKKGASVRVLDQADVLIETDA
jgi:pyruvate/2-oxoglutarate dehydrogenase complex dihydrolipoamide acyltransferase (E2) component